MTGEPEQEKPRASRKRPATTRPAKWEPNAWHRAFASEARLDLGQEAARFQDHHDARGSVFADWDAAFRTWLRNAVKFSAESRNRAGNHHVGGPEQVPEFMRQAAQRGIERDREERRKRLLGQEGT